MPGADRVRRTYRLARTALGLRQRSQRTGTLMHLDRMGSTQFLLQVRRPDDLLSFSARLLNPLRDASRRPSDVLVDTLRAYLDHGANSAAAAAALSVHANTVANRLERIATLTGGDLHDIDHLLDLRLALLIDDIVGQS
jgi:DNA-binding PucR family transcriptional regulator